MAESQTSSLASLVVEARALRESIAAARDRLAEIGEVFAARAKFPDGCLTGYVQAGDTTVKVQKKSTVKWDQNALHAAYGRMGGELFKRAFTYEFKPLPARQFKAFMADPDVPNELKKLIEDARTVTEGKPSVFFLGGGEAEDA